MESSYDCQVLVETSTHRFEQVIRDMLCSWTDQRRATDVATATPTFKHVPESGPQKLSELPCG
jgi:hypothetical protein